MYCDKCGRKLDNGARYCDHCGCEVDAEAPLDKTQGKTYLDKILFYLASLATFFGSVGFCNGLSCFSSELWMLFIMIAIIIMMLYIGSFVIRFRKKKWRIIKKRLIATVLILTFFTIINVTTYQRAFKIIPMEGYSLGTMDSDGIVTERSIWVNENKDRLLVFNRVKVDDRIIGQGGVYLYDSGKIKDFTEWSIGNDHTLTLCFDKNSGEINKYAYSKRLAGDTWYYYYDEEELRIGSITYYVPTEGSKREGDWPYDYSVTIEGIVIEDENGYRL